MSFVFDAGIVDEVRLVKSDGFYATTVEGVHDDLPDQTTDDYAEAQWQLNAQKTLDFILPQIEAIDAKTVLDVGCGIGKMVTTLSECGLNAYGVDLSGLQTRWRRLGMPRSRFFVVGADVLTLPFRDGGVDFAFSLGVIEHVGTSDGNACRREDYHAVRQQWTREIFRTLKVGGCMLLAGPNRGFPVDVAHGLDSRASVLERWLSKRIGTSVHKTWGANFLWGYRDFDRYLEGCEYALRPLSVASFLHHSRVPRPLRALVKGYVNHLPKTLLGTGFNPWTAVLIRKTGP